MNEQQNEPKQNNFGVGAWDLTFLASVRMNAVDVWKLCGR